MAELWALNENIVIQKDSQISGGILFSLAANTSEVFKEIQLVSNRLQYITSGGVTVVVANRNTDGNYLANPFVWADDVYRVLQINSHTASSKAYTWIQNNGAKVDFAASLIAIDETKYNALSVGNHTVTMKAKGAGYADSPLSLGAVFNKKE